MTKQFTAIIREVGPGSLSVTIPSEIVQALTLKPGDICDLTVKKDEEAEKILAAKTMR